MKFTFRARTEEGEVREGIVDAVDIDTAAQILQRNNLIPLSLKAENEKSFEVIKTVTKLWEGVSQKEQMVFFRQMSTLIEARVPIVSALTTIGEEINNPYFAIIINEMASDVQDGMPFSDALAKHEDIFSTLTVNMIHAGEVSGALQNAVNFVADNIEKNYHLTSKIKGALYYPVFVLLVAAIIGFLVVTFILPKITILIKDLKVAVPWYTEALIWLGDFMNAYWWAVLLLIAAGLGSLYYYLKTPSGHRELEMFILKIPVIGTLAQNIYITRLAENLSALLNSGIPIVKALTIVSEVVGNHVYAKIIMNAAEQIRSGGNISSAFVAAKEIPPVLSQMIRIGEESGTLATVLQSVSKFYSQEVDNMTKSLTTLIEPILIVFLGIGVAILVVGVLLPIYNLAGQM
ncbi:MAG: type II secretion system F family protein [Candidatus Moranbacteria bacterium]|nr:type II secretion system F family protein [Candidatus Moranbacteria bacterium]